jgi:hypothetical protein
MEANRAEGSAKHIHLAGLIFSVYNISKSKFPQNLRVEFGLFILIIDFSGI